MTKFVSHLTISSNAVKIVLLTNPMKMISSIDPLKSAITSIASATIGSMSSYLSIILFVDAEVLFKHLAWTIAAIAGIVSIMNGLTKFIDWCRKGKEIKEEEQDAE